jgi:hypothetical protein
MNQAPRRRFGELLRPGQRLRLWHALRLRPAAGQATTGLPFCHRDG